ncbi:MAG: hypothetical protein DBP02_01930 [gamma proteobacterium symbiont of Ctena orbiculata]|nr:MAG: hypothetical protein DBP02_01930 [gamma proteobacterium symbiont of Ctena orbiculata]
MTVIPVNERYRIAADSHSWMIQQSGNRKNKDSGEMETAWTAIRWYNTLNKTVHGLMDLAVRTSDAQGVQEVLEAQKDMLLQLSAALTPEYTIDIKRVCSPADLMKLTGRPEA